MEYTKLGRTDLTVSRICFGTMLFGEGTNYVDACGQLSLAVEAGVNFFDSAEMYPGLSEEYLGRWMKTSGLSRERLVVATKVAGPSGQMVWIRGGPSAVDAANITAAIDGSLRRLGTDYIDLYQIHWPDRYVPMFGDTDYDAGLEYAAVPLEEQLEALSRAVSAGKVRHVGVSNETPWGVMRLCHLADNSASLTRIASVQNAYSLLCRTFDMTLGEVCRKEGVSLLAYSPLAMGLLTGKYYMPGEGGPEARLNKYRGRYAEAEGRYPVENPHVKAAVCAYVDLAKKHNMTPEALALGFVLRHPLVASAVVGASSLGQLRDLLKCSQVVLSTEVMESVDAIHRQYPNPTP
eukprot:jgi/Mesen1/4275/ME000022S03564